MSDSPPIVPPVPDLPPQAPPPGPDLPPIPDELPPSDPDRLPGETPPPMQA
jgi:hypothetical protein